MSVADSDDFEVRNARGAVRFLVWTFVWVATMVLVDKAVLYDWVTSRFVLASAIAVNAALGLGVIRAYLLHLRGMDEMQRRVQMVSLAIAMGVGFVGSFTYSLLVTAGFITDAEISDILALAGKTVEHHRRSIRQKLNVVTDTQLGLVAARYGLDPTVGGVCDGRTALRSN